MNTSRPPGDPQTRLNLFLTPSHVCGYLPGEHSSTLFVDPATVMHPALYEQLLERGFRRSGQHVYRPFCASCQACVPVRIPVNLFQASRNLRRVWQRNADLQTHDMVPVYHPEYFHLYSRYLTHRHQGGPMDNPQPETFLDFL
ncbi:MAG: arginyltransferase, partial [Magnetococcus sp. DMHC-1]